MLDLGEVAFLFWLLVVGRCAAWCGAVLRLIDVWDACYLDVGQVLMYVLLIGTLPGGV